MIRTTARVGDSQRFSLGLFAANCDSGLAMTTVPERWRATWPNTLALAKLADDAGLDFMLPIAHWRGFEGSLDPLGWAAGILANTSRIAAFTTLHAYTMHPVFAAKQLATVDQMSQGRLAFNLVLGWRRDESAMFGGTALGAQAQRYEYGREWLDIVRRLWQGGEPFDYEGTFFKLEGVTSSVVPFANEELVIMNAGTSKEGQAFAAAHADCWFAPAPPDTEPEGARPIIEGFRALAPGRRIGVYGVAYVVCRDTLAEAEEYLHYYAEEHQDVERVDNIAGNASRDLHATSIVVVDRTRMAAGHNGFPFVGDPDAVAQRIARFAECGFSGLGMGFVNYLDEFPYFAEHVLPRLERAGVRTTT